MTKVLLLDGDSVQAISVARSLKQFGCIVYAFMEHRISFGFVSRFIDKKIITVNALQENLFLRELFHFLDVNSVDVIIPLFDDSSFFLSKYKNQIESQYNVKCAIECYETYIKAANKESLMEICKKNTIPHPLTASLSQDINQVISYVGFPAMIKPNISAGARGIIKVDSKEDLIEKLPFVVSNFGDCTLQQYVENSGFYYNVMMYRDYNGHIHESTIIKIMRYFPLKGGSSCYCQTIKNQYLESICARVLNVLDWHGFADFDVMEEKDTGEFYIIEINPRIPASIHASFISNVNFPRMIVEDILGKEISRYDVRYGQEMRYLGLDVMWFLFSKERFKFKPSWFKFFGKNVYYQDMSKKDPFPTFMGMISGVIKYLNPQFRKSKLNK